MVGQDLMELMDISLSCSLAVYDQGELGERFDWFLDGERRWRGSYGGHRRKQILRQIEIFPVIEVSRIHCSQSGFGFGASFDPLALSGFNPTCEMQ